jgi:phosphodiesterase/alkaline phosphatase D-like protein
MGFDIHQRLRPHLIVPAVLVALAVVTGLVATARAATYTVGTPKDVPGTCAEPAAGKCSLRQLIDYEDALAATPSPRDEIVVPAGTYSLASGELAITQSLSIVGAGARTTHVAVPAGVPAARVFDIEVPSGGSEPSVAISGLEISGGTADEANGFFGGDVLNAGSLVLDEDWVTEGDASSGGGISNNGGTLLVERSLVSGNHATSGGGDSGGIQNHGTEVCGAACFPGKKGVLTVEDSTVAYNDARLGAGIFSWSDASDGNEVSVIDSTIADNTTKEETGGAPRGPGAGLLVSDGTAEVANSILALNAEIDVEGEYSPTNCATSESSKIVSLGYNIESETDCGFTSTGDLQDTFPDFSSSEPQDNGGATNTLALEPTSPGVDAIPTSNSFCDGSDQRGVSRPQGAGCDIGAVELVPFTIEATEGSAFSGALTTARCSIFGTPTIEWGDGQTSDATVNGEGEISGTHTYAEAGTYNGSVNYEDDCGLHRFPFQAKVADAPLSATGVPVSADAGVKFSATVAKFSDANPDGKASDYTATIKWGDGSSAAGTIAAAAGGGFEVKGSHTYASGGVYKTTVTIDDVGGSTATATSKAEVIGPPVISEVGVGGVTDTTATIKLAIEPDGADTTYRVRYGPSASYSQETKSVEIGAARGAQQLEQTLTGLEPNSIYHFDVVAVNSRAPEGVSSEDQTFTTLQRAPTVVTGSASSITQTTATLNATVNPHGGEVTSCKLEYGKTEAYGSSAPCSPSPGSGRSPVAVSAAVEGLEHDTTYHFRVVAGNGGGTSTGGDATFKTLPKAPTVVTGSASAVTQTTATLNATVNPNGANVTSCELEYGETEAYGSSVPCSPSPGSGTVAVAVSGAIEKLAPDTTYHFRVSAKGAGGTRQGSDASFKTLPKAPTVVTEPVSVVAQTTATLNATVNPNGANVTSCKLEYGKTEEYGSSAPCSPGPGGGTSAVAVSAAIEGLEANATYHFRVVATNSGGTGTGGDVSFDTLPGSPTVTTGAASAVTQTVATLNATVNPNGANVTSCKLEYGKTEAYGSSVPCSPSPGSGTVAVAVSGAIEKLAPDTTYHFRVSATGAGGISRGTDVSFKTLPDPPTVKTESPSAVTQTMATLNAKVNPHGGEVTSCKLEYGKTETYGSSAPCSPSPGGGTSAVAVAATVLSLEANTTYHFRVSASNAGGKSVGGDQSFTTLPKPVVALSLPTTSTQVGASFSEAATVTEDGTPLTEVEVTFTVTGANPQVGVVMTNEEGQATFTYTGEHAGSDRIVASFVDEEGATISDEVTQTWTASAAGGGGTTGGGTTGGGNGSGGSGGGGTAGGSGSGGTTGGGGAEGGGGGPQGNGGVLAFDELSPPVLGKTVNVVPVSGLVYVKLPPGAQLGLAGSLAYSGFASLHKGIGFIPLTEARQIPVGSILETTHGVVGVTTATTSSANGKLQSGDFGAGIFKLLQGRRQKGLTELNIIDNRSARQACFTLGKQARVAASHPSSKTLGRLNASAHGRFTTRGQDSAATVRGTEWSVANQCDGTLTHVKRGVVSVRDFRRRKTITLFTGESYLARAAVRRP